MVVLPGKATSLADLTTVFPGPMRFQFYDGLFKVIYIIPHHLAIFYISWETERINEFNLERLSLPRYE